MADLVVDSLGWAYIGIDIIWTVALVCGMGFLYYHRELPCIRIRRLPILFLGIVPLHLYGFVCVLGYVLGSLVPCVAMFWIMRYIPIHPVRTRQPTDSVKHLPTFWYRHVPNCEQPVLARCQSTEAIRTP
jgi:hypothetical protein